MVLDNMKVWQNSYTREEKLDILNEALKSTVWLGASIHEWTWSDDKAAVMAYALTLVIDDPTLYKDLREREGKKDEEFKKYINMMIGEVKGVKQ
jgi:hypothetical protein